MKGSTKIFIDEIQCNPPRKKYENNKIVYNLINETWSINLVDFLEYETSNSKGYRQSFVIIGKFSNCTWCIPLKNINIQTMTKKFSNFPTKSKRDFVKIETDRGAEIYNSIFENFLKC